MRPAPYYPYGYGYGYGYGYAPYWGAPPPLRPRTKEEIDADLKASGYVAAGILALFGIVAVVNVAGFAHSSVDSHSHMSMFPNEFKR